MNVSHKSRRRRAGLMALCMLATCGAMLPENSVQQTVSADSFGLYGDLDGNGMVNAMDLQLLKSYVLGNITSFPAGDASFGDLTGDGQVNKADIQILQDYLMSRCNGFIQQGTVYDNIYFAKHAALELAATETTNAGSLTGTYVNVDNVQGSAVTWTVQAPVEGNYRVDLRFANGSGAVRPMALQCNNGSDTWTLSFAATSGWTDWQTYSLVLKLNAGANTLRVTSTQDAGGPNLDYLRLTRTDAEATAPDAVDPPVTEEVTLADMPAEYTTAMEWIWTNRIQDEQSTARRNTIFDQIVGGNGSINYVIRWQSYKHITLEQRQKLEQLLEDAINGWTDYLVGYEGWKYQHVDVKIVGWAVLDKSCLEDLQPDEIVYDNLLEPYDSSRDTSNGVETIPNLLPSAPDELSRFYHFSNNIGFDYPGGLDKRFDMYLWATQGFPSIGGCGGDWGQRLSDDAYLNIINSGFGIHVLEHELGHGFGLTDFYGGEGEKGGFPPGGFPGGENSLMMAGSASKITDFDSWMLRYVWSKIKDESGRFS